MTGELAELAKTWEFSILLDDSQAREALKLLVLSY